MSLLLLVHWLLSTTLVACDLLWVLVFSHPAAAVLLDWITSNSLGFDHT